MKTITADSLKNMLSKNDHPTVINTLPEESFAKTKIPGSINIPQDQEGFAQRVEQHVGSRDQPVVVYCASESCNSSSKAAQKLDEAGFSTVYDFEAGAEGWKAAGEKLQGASA